MGAPRQRCARRAADMISVPLITSAVIERIKEGGLGYSFYDEPIPVLEAFKLSVQSL